MELVQSREQIHHLRHLMYLIDENVILDESISSLSSSSSYDNNVTNIDDIEDDSKPNYSLEKNYYLNDSEQTDNTNNYFFLYRKEDNIDEA
ncbi:unnamed protein product [Didymodactylos carnosus]|nr:unnamed protein product [Didymodactylos carnosus]